MESSKIDKPNIDNKNLPNNKIAAATSSVIKNGMPQGQKQQLKEKTNSKTKTQVNIYILVLGIVNLICLFVLIFILSLLPKKAEELKNLRSLIAKANSQQSREIIIAEISAAKNKTEKLIELFPNEDGLVEFTGQIDSLRNQGAAINFSFANDIAVKDKTGLIGLPILIEVSGTNTQVDSALKQIQNMPFLLRAIDVEINKIEDNKIRLKFGGILYVNENFSAN